MRFLNRLLIMIIGLAMIIAALAAIAIGTGLATLARPVTDQLGRRIPAPGESVLPAEGVDVAIDSLLIMIAVIAIGVALLALLWLIALVPRPTPATALRLHTDPGEGTITLEPKVLEGAVEQRLVRLRGVTGARVTIRGAVAQPDVDLSITVDEQADLADLVDRVHSAILPGLADALETRLRRVAVVLQLGRRSDSDSEVTIEGRGTEVAAASGAGS